MEESKKASASLVRRNAMVCPACSQEQPKTKEKRCSHCGSKYVEGTLWERQDGKKPERVISY